MFYGDRNYPLGPFSVFCMLRFDVTTLGLYVTFRYPYTGGMQDFNYIFSNAMELTIEVSCCKYPTKSVLLQQWDFNMKSLIELVEQAHIGIKGIVTRGSPNGPRIANAKIFVRRLYKDEESSR